ncbi:MAG: hypothetical protein HWQ38_38000 [Nostoc sp. NMS7]|uniref:hypothetical protein n=1 Tax=Nostoc sp. NMS7 TaxID=2815391 RepID=UPI0025E8E06B|nr:hypothetical protein [Nostoc sp. NMS7]MBN3951952.1 hypothetical protein [Nostoc sp. NMS7]
MTYTIQTIQALSANDVNFTDIDGFYNFEAQVKGVVIAELSHDAFNEQNPWYVSVAGVEVYRSSLYCEATDWVKSQYVAGTLTNHLHCQVQVLTTRSERAATVEVLEQHGDEFVVHNCENDHYYVVRPNHHSLCAILSVAADEDNDGNTASEKKSESRGRLQLKNSARDGAPASKTSAVHPQDLRVKLVREVLGYPRDLIVEWLQSQGVERPSQLEPHIVDELIKTMCLAWAADKTDHPNHAENSYALHVSSVVSPEFEELGAIKQWMMHIQQTHPASVKA